MYQVQPSRRQHFPRLLHSQGGVRQAGGAQREDQRREDLGLHQPGTRPGQQATQHHVCIFIINTYLFLVSSGLHILMEGPLGKVEKFLSLIFLAPQ